MLGVNRLFAQSLLCSLLCFRSAVLAVTIDFLLIQFCYEIVTHFYRARLLYTRKTEMSNVKGVLWENFTGTISVNIGTKAEGKGNGRQLHAIKRKNNSPYKSIRRWTCRREENGRIAKRISGDRPSSSVFSSCFSLSCFLFRRELVRGGEAAALVSRL